MNHESGRPDLSLFSKTTFWDVDITKIDWNKSKDWIIRRIVEYGFPDEIREICRFYGREEIIAVASQPKGFRLYNTVKQNLEKYVYGAPTL